MKLNELKAIAGRDARVRVFDKHGECGVKDLVNKRIVYIHNKRDLYEHLTEESVESLKGFGGDQFLLVPNGKNDKLCTAYYFNWGYGGNLDFPAKLTFK